MNFEEMRIWLWRMPGSIELKRARISLFDRYRYQEEYEKLYNFIIEMGWKYA